MKKQISILRLAAAFASAALLLLFTGCQPLPREQQTIPTTNSEFTLYLLFEKDGCKIYRFEDGRRDVYWTDCRGKIESIHTESNGKSSKEVRVQNEIVD
jgi:hypothetical protein